MCSTLSSSEAAVRREVSATKAAWPIIFSGLPAPSRLTASQRLAIASATRQALALTVPGIFQEGNAPSITGPASSVAGLFRSFAVLAARAWTQISAALQEIEHGSPVAARFAKANVNLYIESLYDAHFTLAEIGKRVLSAYKDLRGAPAFGSSLTPAEVDSLAASYSNASDRLEPHVVARLGS